MIFIVDITDCTYLDKRNKKLNVPRKEANLHILLTAGETYRDDVITSPSIKMLLHYGRKRKYCIEQFFSKHDIVSSILEILYTKDDTGFA